MNASVVNLLTPIFREVFNMPNLILEESMGPNDIESWDSLNHIILITQIEAVANVTFKADELADLRNVGEIVSYLHSKGIHY